MVDEALEQDEIVEDEKPSDDTDKPEDEDTKSQEDETEEDDDEIIVTIGDQKPDDYEEDPDEDRKAPQWVRNLRKDYRSIKRENRELKQKIHEVTRQPVRAADNYDPGPMPTFEECDFDQAKFNEKFSAWKGKYEKKIERQTAQKYEQEKQNSQWQKQLEAYQHKKKSLKVRDYEDAELVTQDILNVTQQGMIVQGADNPAIVVYALGKNPKLAQELASEKDPIKFAFKVAKLETQLKTTKRKPRTKPEETIKTSGKISGTTDSNLERLRAEAERTGNYSKVSEYKRMLKKRKAG